MSRQINLYAADFLPKPKRFTAAWSVVAVAVVTTAALAYYAFEAQRVKQLQAAQAIAELQFRNLRDQLLKLGIKPPETDIKALEAEVARAEALLASRQALFDWLKSGEIGNRDGYAGTLEALARQRVAGIWLTDIGMSGAPGEFLIKGRALRADILPSYLKLLSNEAAFRGKPLGTLSLTEIELDPSNGQLPAASARGSTAAGQKQLDVVPVRALEFSIGTKSPSPMEATKR